MLQVKQALAWLFVSVLAFAADSDFNITERSKDDSIAVRRSASPSGINPIAAINSMTPGTYKLIEGVDLSEYIVPGKDMELFLGYGVYDTGEQHCVFVEKEGNDKIGVDVIEDSITRIGHHTYAVAKNNLNFSGCQALAGKYGGYMLVVDDAAEQGNIAYEFLKKYDGDIWLGLTRANCSDPQFTSQHPSGRVSDYLYLREAKGKEGTACSPLASALAMSEDDGRWIYANPSKAKRCVIEFDSPDLTRPQQLCAPWIRIERSYQNKWYEEDVANQESEIGAKVAKSLTLDPNDIYKGTIPLTMNLCTKTERRDECFNEDNTTKTVQTQCVTYYDRRASPLCDQNPIQDLCFVNECKGYIESTCQEIDRIEGSEYPGVKNYTKIPTADGTEDTKLYDRLTTRIYQCPACASGVWTDCKERQKVRVWGERCDDNRSLAFPAANEKDMEFVNGEDGLRTLVGLWGKCPGSDERIYFDITKAVRVDSTACVKYDEVKTTTSRDYTCAVDRSFVRREILVQTDDEDPYLPQASCLRANTPEDAIGNFQYALKVSPGDSTFRGYYIKQGGDVKPMEILAYEAGDDARINKHIADIQKILGKPRPPDQELNGTQGEMSEAEYCEKFPEKKRCVQKEICDAWAGRGWGDNWRRLVTYSEPFASKVQMDIGENNPACDVEEDENGNVSDNQAACPPPARETGVTPLFLANANGKKYLFYEKATKQECDRTLSLVDYYGAGRAIYRSCAAGYDYNATEARCQKTLPALEPNAACPNAGDTKIGRVCVSNVLVDDRGLDINQYPLSAFNKTAANLLHTDDSDSVNKLCLIEKLQEDGDKYIAKGEVSGANSDDPTVTLTMINTNLVSSADTCKSAAYCLNGDGYVNNGVCKIQVDSDTPTEEDEDGGVPPDLGDFFDYEAPKDTEGNGTMDGNGIFYFTETYEIGGVGMEFMSTTHTAPVFSATAMINDRKLHPLGLIKPEEVVEELKHYYDFYEKRIRTGKKVMPDTAFFGAGVAGSALAGFFALPYTIELIWGKYRFYSQFNLWWKVTRPIGANKIIASKGAPLSPLDMRQIDGNELLYYGDARWRFGPYDEDDAEDIRDAYYEATVKTLVSAGFVGDEFPYWDGREFDESIYADFFHEIVSGKNHASVPGKCSWYVMPRNCKKTKSKREDGVEDQYRKSNVIWTNATNALTIIVPNGGEYSVSAFDQYGNKLSSVNVKKDSWIGDGTGGEYRYRQLYFGENMTLSGGHEAQRFDWLRDSNILANPECRFENYAEWGGGASGVYYEVSKNCGKSDTEFVRDHAATRIEVLPQGQIAPYVINLRYPLPFANRVTLVSLDKDEMRVYNCYGDAPQCLPPDKFE
jgi:hypothetical protein